MSELRSKIYFWTGTLSKQIYIKNFFGVGVYINKGGYMAHSIADYIVLFLIVFFIVSFIYAVFENH